MGTLDISQKRVANYHKRAVQNVFIDRRGVHTKRSIPEETKAYKREHINSFPRMPSHYCRSNTKKNTKSPNLRCPGCTIYMLKNVRKNQLSLQSLIYTEKYSTLNSI